MIKATPENFKLAAKLTFVNATVTFVSFFSDEKLPKSALNFVIILVATALTVLFGFLMLRKLSWIKYVILTFTAIGIWGIIRDPGYYLAGGNVLQILIVLISIILQFCTLFLLFKKNRRPKIS